MLIYIVLFLIIFLIWLRYSGPVFVRFVPTRDTTDLTVYSPERVRNIYVGGDIDMKLQASSASFILRAFLKFNRSTLKANQIVGGGSWRTIPIGGYFVPFLSFRIPFTSVVVHPLHNVGARVSVIDYKAVQRGFHVHPRIVQDKDLGWCVLVYNGSDFPVEIKHGEPVVQIDFYRVPQVFLLGKDKEGFDG